METTSITKMERDFKAKTDEATNVMNKMIANMTKQVKDLSITIDAQMDTQKGRQTSLVADNNKLHDDMNILEGCLSSLLDENNNLHIDIDSLKVAIKQLESRVLKDKAGYTGPKLSAPTHETRSGVEPHPT